MTTENPKILSLIFQENIVRTIGTTHYPLFVVADVCKVLEIVNTTQAIEGLEEDDLSTTEVLDALGRPQKTNCVTFPGLLQLITKSRKPEARAFKKWVWREVVPEALQRGSYSLPIGYTPNGPGIEITPALEAFLSDRYEEKAGEFTDWMTFSTGLLRAKLMTNYNDIELWMNRIFKLRPHWRDWQRQTGIQNISRRLGPTKSPSQLLEA